MSTVLSTPTGMQVPPSTRTLLCNFNQYEVVLRISESGEVLGVEEIRIRKDFRSPNQIGYVDVDDYYRE